MMKEIIDERILRLLERDDFYEGESSNPIHRELKLKLATIKMAHFSITPVKDNRIDVSNPFSSGEERKFAVLQLHANKYLQSRQKPLLPLLHLSMHMLLPFNQVPSDSHKREESTSLPSETIPKTDNVPSKSKSKKKKKANKKHGQPVIAQNDSDSHLPENALPVDDCRDYKDHADVHQANQTDTPISESPVIHSNSTSSSTLKEEKTSLAPRHWNTLSIPLSDIEPMLSSLSHLENQQLQLFDVCSAYERYIMSLRETYETAIHAANLKTFIADNENERLKEELRKLQNQTRPHLPFR